MLNRFMIQRKDIHTQSGERLFWLVETSYHHDLADLTEDLVDNKLVCVTQLMTRQNGDGDLVITEKRPLTVSLDSIHSINLPTKRIVDGN